MDQLKAWEWICSKIEHSPEILRARIVPELERMGKRAIAERDQANRKGSLEDIRYAQGWLDGVQAVLNLPEMMRKLEAKERPEQALLARILSPFRKEKN